MGKKTTTYSKKLDLYESIDLLASKLSLRKAGSFELNTIMGPVMIHMTKKKDPFNPISVSKYQGDDPDVVCEYAIEIYTPKIARQLGAYYAVEAIITLMLVHELQSPPTQPMIDALVFSYLHATGSNTTMEYVEEMFISEYFGILDSMREIPCMLLHRLMHNRDQCRIKTLKWVHEAFKERYDLVDAKDFSKNQFEYDTVAMISVAKMVE